jgi:ferric-chelate reductase
VLFPNGADGDVVRLDFTMKSSSSWKIGQHFYLCFPEGSIWQSHPMTPLSHPGLVDRQVTHSYVFRAKSGETKKIAELVAKRLASVRDNNSDNSSSRDDRTGTDISVLLTGPYGENLADQLAPMNNILCVAGGTGITYVLPVLLELAKFDLSGRKIDLIWVVRRSKDAQWVGPELDILRANSGITVRIMVTREDKANDSDNVPSVDEMIGEKETGGGESVAGTTQLAFVGGEDQPPARRHPDLIKCVNDFVERTASGRTVVFGSGPVGMISDLRKAVAALNSGMKVWRGEERHDVTLCYDERLER